MRVLIRLAGYAWRHKMRLLLAYLAMAAATAAAIAIPRFLGAAIDQALSTGLRRELLYLGLAIVATSVLRGVFSYLQNYMSGGSLPDGCLRHSKRFLQEAAEPQLRLPRPPADGKPDVQGDGRCRGCPQVYQHGDDPSALRADDGSWGGHDHADDQLAAGTGHAGLRASHHLARRAYGRQAPEHVDDGPGPRPAI